MDWNKLEDKELADWNRLVQGLMLVCDVARILGIDQCLLQRLEEDDGTLAERIGCLGADRRAISHVLLTCWRAVGGETVPMYVP